MDMTNDDAEETEDQGSSWRVGRDGLVYRQGVRNYPNQDVYQGEFVGTQRHGRGALTSIDGSSYSGEFANDKFHGKGKKVWAPFDDHEGRHIELKSYEGEWKDGLFHGRGVLKLGEGIGSYIGSFQNGLYDGEGVLHRSDERYTIKGVFAKGFPLGVMVVKYDNGSVYEGTLKLYGKGFRLHGEGKLTLQKGLGSYEVHRVLLNAFATT